MFAIYRTPTYWHCPIIQLKSDVLMVSLTKNYKKIALIATDIHDSGKYATYYILM